MIQSNRLVAIGILVLGIGIGVLVLALFKGCGNQGDELLSRQLKENTIIKQEFDELGRQVTTASLNYVTKEELKESDDAMIKEIRDNVAGPLKSLERSTRILSSKVEHLQLAVHDTTIILHGQEVAAKTFSYSSLFMPKLKGVLTVDSLWLDYEIRADYQLEYHWQKTKGLFSPKELQVIVRSNDPAVTVNQVQTLSIHNPTPWFRKPLPMAMAGFGSGVLVGLVIDSAVQ